MDQYKGHEHFAKRVGGYSFLAPESFEEIKEEGAKLNHCVATYVPRVSRGDVLILFMRPNKDTPNVTLEYRKKNNAIVQARGYGNRSLNDRERDALER
jgi:hypothetical protein